MLSVEEALTRCLALVAPLAAESVPLRAAVGRMMAGPVTALRDQPPFAASAMDGYAVQGDHAPGARFRLTGQAQAGTAFAGTVGPGEAVRIFTGAPVPMGADRVIIQEDVTAEDGVITLRPKADTARHIRPRGQDFKAGDSVPPRRITPHDLALLAAMNVPQVQVHRRPVVAIIATGDELVLPGEVPGPDQIICSNAFALAALIEAEGGIARLLPIARDTEAELRSVFALAGGADLIVTIGGASVGDHDLVGPVAQSLGLERAFWRIAMRPGKPLMAGKIGAVPMLGLPGNPVSSIVCAHLFLLPMIRALQGRPDVAPLPRTARLGAAVEANGPRTHYMRARLKDGVITPFERQDSALIGILTEANALLIRPLGDAAQESGAEVLYLPL
ncbi:molybdopterin molybdenumtransferase MoeA [bacterium]|nr:molybdopterin molybdenumtransferase MoeA [bacterium]